MPVSMLLTEKHLFKIIQKEHKYSQAETHESVDTWETNMGKLLKERKS